MDPIIRLTKLSKHFGEQKALDEVSLEVPRGTVFALLGENGAGKTTAIRIMLGLLRQNSGQAEVLGLDSGRQGLEIRRRVGYVPERPALYDWMTVEEIGWFTAGFYANGFLTEYSRLASQFALPVKQKIKTLSKGMRAKVVLALAMAHQPELLVLDEPTSGLDVLVRHEFLENMVDRAAAGQTVFLSSHQIVEVERVADIVAILRNGKLTLVERLDELKADTRKLTVTLKDGHSTPPDLGIQVISQQCKRRQCQMIARGADQAKLTALRNHEAVEQIDVHSATLEDIFVAYMRQDDGSSRGQSIEEGPRP
jgi:ABC-2 type transport system ATP-binding protein